MIIGDKDIAVQVHRNANGKGNGGGQVFDGAVAAGRRKLVDIPVIISGDKDIAVYVQRDAPEVVVARGAGQFVDGLVAACRRNLKDAGVCASFGDKEIAGSVDCHAVGASACRQGRNGPGRRNLAQQ